MQYKIAPHTHPIIIPYFCLPHSTNITIIAVQLSRSQTGPAPCCCLWKCLCIKACIAFLIDVKIPMKSTVKKLKMSYSIMYFFQFEKIECIFTFEWSTNDKRYILNTVGSLSVFWVCCDRKGISLPLFRMSSVYFHHKSVNGWKIKYSVA